MIFGKSTEIAQLMYAKNCAPGINTRNCDDTKHENNATQKEKKVEEDERKKKKKKQITKHKK